MKHKLEVSFKVDEEGNKFGYIDVGYEAHGRKSYRLWVSGKLIKEGKRNIYFVEFPVKGRIIVTEKGNLVLRPDEDYIVHYLYVPCGYRGRGDFEILSPTGVEYFVFYGYNSPLGSLGVDKGALLNVPKDEVVKYKWKRTGRLYGKAPEGISIIMPDGEERDFEDVPDGLESLEEIKKLVEVSNGSM